MSKEPRPVLVIADGWDKTYPSITEAAIALGISPFTLGNKLRKGDEDGAEVKTKKYGMVAVDYA